MGVVVQWTASEQLATTKRNAGQALQRDGGWCEPSDTVLRWSLYQPESGKHPLRVRVDLSRRRPVKAFKTVTVCRGKLSGTAGCMRSSQRVLRRAFFVIAAAMRL